MTGTAVAVRNGGVHIPTDPITLGTIRRRDQVGLAGRSRVAWAACPGCGARRWVPVNTAPSCRACSRRALVESGHLDRIRALPSRVANRDQTRAKNHRWNGGRVEHSSGYIRLLLPGDDPLRYTMADTNGYAMEHRVVMARSIGRPLAPSESVHHLNGDRHDNRIENLELWVGGHPSGVRAADGHCPTCTCNGDPR